MSAPPVEGAANDALIDYLADVLRVPRRAITIISGFASRQKIVQVDGVEADRIQQLAEGRAQARK